MGNQFDVPFSNSTHVLKLKLRGGTEKTLISRRVSARSRQIEASTLDASTGR